MAKHTPGPWVVGADLVGIITGYRDGTPNTTKNGWAKTITKVTHASWAGIEEHVANARLIAAAPDLLEALKDIICAFAMNNAEPAELRAALVFHIEKAAALAKALSPAEGEE